MKQYTNWRKTWTTILTFVDFSNNNRAMLLFYDRAAGLGELWATDGQGGISLVKQYPQWRKTWDLIIPCALSGDVINGLVFYDRAAGLGKLYATDGNGNLHLVSRHADWSHDWRAIVGGTFVGIGEPSLLFYHR